jgi:hypothetical protein
MATVCHYILFILRCCYYYYVSTQLCAAAHCLPLGRGDYDSGRRSAGYAANAS